MENVKICKKRRFRGRRFFDGEVHHIYQRTVSRFNIFYDLEDYLVYYTIFSSVSRKYEITVLGLCLMFDHIHMLVKAQNKVAMSEFVRQVTSMFAREQNTEVGRRGSLFQARFGSAPKKGHKLLRTAIAYLYNNPVEKGLCNRVEDYRWNFLAYYVSEHPFSEKIIRKSSSRSLRNAMKEVEIAESEDRHLRYGQLFRMLNKLRQEECIQLVDYIISLYNPIAYEETIDCYGSYEKMLIAVNSNTGSEYEIKEDKYKFSDTIYIQMIDVLRNVEGLRTIRKVTGADEAEKMRLFGVLRRHLSCSNQPIAKFLHINLINV